jgi:hypothetical protein
MREQVYIREESVGGGRGRPDATLPLTPDSDMPNDVPLAEFIRRIRAGDAGAVREMMRRYGPVVRLEARLRLTDPLPGHPVPEEGGDG